MIGIDTNILVRYVVQDDVGQARKAAKILEREISEKKRGFVSAVVLAELCWTLEAVFQYPKDDVLEVLERLASAAELKIEHADEVWRAIHSARSLNVDFPDALIGLVNRKEGCETTRTFDRKAKRMDCFSSV